MYNQKDAELLTHVPALDNYCELCRKSFQEAHKCSVIIFDEYKNLIEEHPDILHPEEEVEEEVKQYHPPSRLA